MALSPYAKLGYTTLRDLRMPEIPMELLNDTLKGLEANSQLTEASLLKSPQYIRESESDRQLAEQINMYQQGVRDQLSEIAATGDTKAYMSALRQAQQRLYDIYRPGGAADVLSQRLQQKQSRDAKIAEQYKDSPHIAQYYQGQPIGDLGYNQQTGMFNQIGMPKGMVRDVSAKEFDEWANRNLDNLKDTLLYDENGKPIQGMTKTQIDGITSIVDLYELKGVTPERIQSALLRIMPQEYVASAEQDFAARGLEYDSELLTPEGALNPNNPIASKILGYSQIAARQSRDRQRFKVEDWQKQEAIRQANRKALEDYKQRTLRIEGQSIGFNPQTRPKSMQELNSAIDETTSLVNALNRELSTTSDPQRRSYIQAQIKWAEANLQTFRDIETQALNSTNKGTSEVFDRLNPITPFGTRLLTQEEINTDIFRVKKEDVLSYLANPDLGYNDEGVAVLAKLMSDGSTFEKAKEKLEGLQAIKFTVNSSANSWLENNANAYNVQLGTISLDKKERDAIGQVLNTNSWTFFDENGPMENKEATSIFGTDKKPIVSENVVIESITAQPFGNFGNLVTISDKNTGKVYYAAPSNSNLGEVVGRNIMETSDQNSDQYLAGLMMANPQYNRILGQLTDFNAGDTRTIVSGTQELGKVKKSKTASGTLYELTVPNVPSKFSNAGQIVSYNNELELAQDLNIINQSLSLQ